MARPRCCRSIDALPKVTHFKPQGVPLRTLEVVQLAVEELEALRLADLEGLYHEAAAERMNVSRATFGRIVAEARRKVAEALVSGKALRIEGGDFEMPETTETRMRTFVCDDCAHAWQLACGTGHPEACPSCAGLNIHRSAGEAGKGCGHGPHQHQHEHKHGQQGKGCCGGHKGNCKS